MSTHSVFNRKNSLRALCLTGLVCGLGFNPPAVAAGDSYFEGFAGLCEFMPLETPSKTKGGITISYGPVFVYRIETDHELVNGYETLISNTKENKAGKQFYFGTATLEPEIAEDSTLAGKFYFPTDANPIRGNYFGTDELEGVVVQYELVPVSADFDFSAWPDFCYGSYPPFFGYLMSGRVHNYETP